jgi:hypothetical protein
MTFLLLGILLIGLIVLYYSIKKIIQTLEFLAKSFPTKAVIIEIVYDVEEDPIPVFHYTDSMSGEECTVRGKVESGFQVGQLVDILYNPENLKDARINTREQVWRGAKFTLVWSILWTTLSIILLIASWNSPYP